MDIIQILSKILQFSKSMQGLKCWRSHNSYFEDDRGNKEKRTVNFTERRKGGDSGKAPRDGHL